MWGSGVLWLDTGYRGMGDLVMDTGYEDMGDEGTGLGSGCGYEDIGDEGWGWVLDVDTRI